MSTTKRIAVLLLAMVFVLSAPGVIYAQEAVVAVEVAISGNQNINTDTILNAVTLKAGDDYSDTVVEKDRAAIMSLGYFSAVSVHKDQVTGGVKVTYEVTENPRITEIRVVGSEPITVQCILDLMKTKSGQVLNTTTFNQDVEAIQQYYGDLGYVAYVTDDAWEGVDPKSGVLTIPILVHIVESVEITGNKKTKEYVFLREMKTKPGKVFNRNVLRDDLIRIYNLDILDVENIKDYQLLPGTELGMVKIQVPVVEKKTGQVSIGFGYSSRQRLVGQAQLSETNFRGKGQGLNLLYQQGTSQAVGGPSSYELGFYEPWLDNRHTSLSVTGFNKVLYRFSSGVFGSSTFADDQTYNERHKGGDATLSRPLSERTRVYLGGRFDNVDTDPSLLGEEIDNDLYKIVQEGKITVGSLRLVHNSRDFDLDPGAGGYESVAAEFGTVSGDRLLQIINPPDATHANPWASYQPIPFDGAYRKVSVDFRRYFSRGGRKDKPTDKRTTVALRVTAGMASGQVPFFEQFFIGGGETLRGYREDRFWGNRMLLASVELRKPIAQGISGVVFLDYGDAWNGDPDFFIGELPQTEGFDGNMGYGVGLRVTTPIGRLRLDYGIGDEGARTHFSMGQAF